MKIGIPKGLLYQDFRELIESFFLELGQDIAISPDTNRSILDLGVGCCVDEACLPVKVFHGHVCWLRDNCNCDYIFIPRVMHLRRNESICPKFCGLPEMIKYSVPGVPPLIGEPIDWSSASRLREWARAVAARLRCSKEDAYSALDVAVKRHNNVAQGYAILVTGNPTSESRNLQETEISTAEVVRDNSLKSRTLITAVESISSKLTDLTNTAKPATPIEGQKKRRTGESKFKIALLGHPYNVKDTFLNMNIAKKLIRLGADIITDESVAEEYVNREADTLFKKPFWTLARYSYGAAKHLYRHRAIDGIVYVSSFACGIDSVVIELIRDEIEGLPLLVLKIDEHTGEAGIDTRIEAFTDLLGRGKGGIDASIASV